MEWDVKAIRNRRGMSDITLAFTLGAFVVRFGSASLGAWTEGIEAGKLLKF